MPLASRRRPQLRGDAPGMISAARAGRRRSRVPWLAPMQRRPIALSPSTPWTLQLYERLPFSDVVVGLLIAAVAYSLFLLLTGVRGHLGQMPGIAVVDPWQSEILLCLLIGIVPTVAARSIRGSLTDLEALRPFLEAEGEDPRQTVMRYDRRLLRFAGASAFVGTFAFVYGDENLWTHGTRPALDDPDAIWLIARNLVNWWLVVRFMTLDLSLAHSFSRLGERLVPLDLLDRTPLLVFGRRGLRSVLLWMLVVAFFSLMYAANWASDRTGTPSPLPCARAENWFW